MPTFDLSDDELAAVAAAIRRAIETDRFPRAPRLEVSLGCASAANGINSQRRVGAFKDAAATASR